MALLERLLLQPMAETPYRDGFWDLAEATNTVAGVAVGPDAAMKVSTYFAGVRLLSFVVGRLPIGVFTNGTRTKDETHWAYRLLAKRPNHWQTPFRWKQWMFVSMMNWGNGYSYMLPSRIAPGSIAELVPIHKTRVTPQRLSSNAVRYQIQRNNDELDRLVPEYVPQELMVHWRTPWGDGLEGQSLLTYTRNTLGHALAQSTYSQRNFSKGLLQRFFTKTPAGTTISEPALSSLKAQLRDVSGMGSANDVLVLPGGIELEPMSMNLSDAQYLQQEEFTMIQLAQFLGIPPHMLELVSRSTSWGTGINEQTIGFAVYTMDPWLTDLEESIDRTFLEDGETHYAKFNRRALLAANLRDRAGYYRTMTGIKSMTPNEVREAEDMDPVEWGDEPLPSPNESVNGQADVDEPAGRQGSSQAQAIAEEAAGRLIRKEIARITHLAKRTASDQQAFAAAVTEFYEGHAEEVAQSLAMSPEAAMAYCEEQRSAVLTHGIAVMESWEGRAAALADLALREENVP